LQSRPHEPSMDAAVCRTALDGFKCALTAHRL
jgi:hypothetical protein